MIKVISVELRRVLSILSVDMFIGTQYMKNTDKSTRGDNVNNITTMIKR